jgi:hypothetical protein
MRPSKPPELIEWEQWVRPAAPQFCHNCDHYSGDGYCYVFQMIPPADFANSKGACPNWEQMLPF